ncbi:hypothetical protein CAEBREN_21904 [Caenorhabditis brenneri]|uniref:Uncharacterized protein n=1 Tax=Caenorhabditis brenneri TaxID=135651 RepID=G0MCZ7_CAEBE|nr:hypothetical protein CAEBREN_21904 [Caenorhabditis brenneri]
MHRPQLPGAIAATAVKLVCLDQIKAITSIRNLESVDWSQIGERRKHVQKDLLMLKDTIIETESYEDVADKWLEKTQFKIQHLDKSQLLKHLDYHMEVIGFSTVLSRAAKTFNDVMSRLKKQSLAKHHAWILQQYRHGRTKRLRPSHQHLGKRIQSLSSFTVEDLIDKARAEAVRIKLALVAHASPQLCSVCNLIGHKKDQCLLGEEAAQGKFNAKELRQQFQDGTDGSADVTEEMDQTYSSFQLLDDVQSRRSEQSHISNSTSSEFDLTRFFIEVEPRSTEREHSILTSPESINPIEEGRGYNHTPEQDSPVSLHGLSIHDVLVVQRGDLSHVGSSGRSTPNDSTHIPSSQHYSSEDEETVTGYQWSVRSRSSSFTIMRSEMPDPDDIFEEPSRLLGPLPCHIIAFHKRHGHFIQSIVYARFWEDNVKRQFKIGDIMQFYEKSDTRMDTQQGILQAAEAIKKFYAQSTESLVPTTVNFFHCSKEFTKDFDEGVKQPFEEIRRILSNQGFPLVNMQETSSTTRIDCSTTRNDSSTTRIADEQRIAQKLFNEWNAKNPTHRNLFKQPDLACSTDRLQDDLLLVVRVNFVVICGDRTGSSAANIFIQQEDGEHIRLRVLQHDYAEGVEDSKELSTKIIIIQACHEIASHIRRSKSPAQVGEILIAHGSRNIALDLKFHRKSHIFEETSNILYKVAPKAAIWFMKTAQQESMPSSDYSTLANLLWSWFKSKDNHAVKNPVQIMPKSKASVQQGSLEAEDRSSKAERDRMQR